MQSRKTSLKYVLVVGNERFCCGHQDVVVNQQTEVTKDSSLLGCDGVLQDERVSIF